MRIGLLILLFFTLIGCGKMTESQNETIDEIAFDRVESAIMQCLIDRTNAQVTNTHIEFKGEHLVVVTCQMIAKNSFGGMTRNIFEYIYTKDGDERVENVAAGSTIYSEARALSADSIYTSSYNSMVEMNILSLMK